MKIIRLKVSEIEDVVINLENIIRVKKEDSGLVRKTSWLIEFNSEMNTHTVSYNTAKERDLVFEKIIKIMESK